MIQLHLDEVPGGKSKAASVSLLRDASGFSESFQNICPTIQYISILSR